MVLMGFAVASKFLNNLRSWTTFWARICSLQNGY